MNSFQDSVRQQTELIFKWILPLYLERYYKNDCGTIGWGFYTRLLSDIENNTFLDILKDGKKPSQEALSMADGARKKCPIVICPETEIDSDKKLVFGKFVFEEIVEEEWEIIQTGERRYGSNYCIMIYEGSCKAVAFSQDEMDFLILKTLLHEVIHYLESFYPPEMRLLKNSEKGIRPKKLKDDDYKMRPLENG